MSLLSFTKKIVGQKDKLITAQKKTVTKKKETTSSAPALLAGHIGLVPLVTEKTVSGSAANSVAFRVHAQATKGQIIAAVVQRYNIRPTRVRTLQSMPKVRRRGASVGLTNSWKKAYVTLPQGKTIDLTV